MFAIWFIILIKINLLKYVLKTTTVWIIIFINILIVELYKWIDLNIARINLVFFISAFNFILVNIWIF